MAAVLPKRAGLLLFTSQMLIVIATPGSGMAEPCNPIIDGTYCATQMPKSRTSAPSSNSNSMNPIRSIGSDLRGGGISRDTPGTLGGISIRGSGVCVGLLSRGRCN